MNDNEKKHLPKVLEFLIETLDPINGELSDTANQALLDNIDFKDVWPNFAIWLLIDRENGIYKHCKNDDLRTIVYRIADIYQSGRVLGGQEWCQVREAAYLDNTHPKAMYVYSCLCSMAVASSFIQFHEVADYMAAYNAQVASISAARASDNEQLHKEYQAKKLIELLNKRK